MVRCRETFQREILKSRHYILKFLARRGFVFREGTHWCTPHLQWLQQLTTDGSPLAPRKQTRTGEWRAFFKVINLTNHENVLGYDVFTVGDANSGLRLVRETETWFSILPSLGVSWSKRF